MKGKNNFHKLNFDSKPSPEIENNIAANLYSFRAVGGVVELYLTKLFDFFIELFGGDSDAATKKKK